MQGREYVFWNHAEWVRMIDARTETADLPLPSFYGQTLETFFLNGQKAGAFRIDVPALWLVRAYDYLLYAAMDAVQRRDRSAGHGRHGAEAVPGRGHGRPRLTRTVERS